MDKRACLFQSSAPQQGADTALLLVPTLRLADFTVFAPGHPAKTVQM